MSVDNSAILFVGLPVSDVDASLIPGIDIDEWGNDPEGCIFRLDRDDKLEIRYTSEYHDPDKVIGYCIGDSDSYGIKEIPNLPERLTTAIDNFRNLFLEKPKIYLYNWQY